MKLLANTSALRSAVAFVASACPGRSNKPVYQCVYVNAAAKSITVRGTDGDLWLTSIVSQCDVAEQGSALIRAEQFNGILAASPDDTITLATPADGNTTICGSDSKYKVFGYAVEEYPPYIPDGTAETPLLIKGADLASMFNDVAFAASGESTRYANNGILFELSGKRLVTVATDGHRLAWRRLSVEQTAAARGIIPMNVIKVIVKLWAKTDDDVSVWLTGGKLIARSATHEICGTLLQGEFPPYADVIPKGSEIRVVMDTERFASAMRRAALMVTEESKGVRVRLAKNSMEVTSRAAEVGEAEIRMAVEVEDAITIGFNPKYVLDALNAADAEEVVLELSTAKKPGVIRRGSDWLCVVMPCSLE